MAEARTRQEADEHEHMVELRCLGTRDTLRGEAELKMTRASRVGFRTDGVLRSRVV